MQRFTQGSVNATTLTGGMTQEVEPDVGGDSEPAPKAPATSHSKPPPENAEAIRVRSLVIFSFWAVVLFLGLPVWWWTTSIHRARLPLREMNDWADGKACKPTFPLRIAIEAPSLQRAEASHLIHLIQHLLDDSNEFSAHHLRLQFQETDAPRQVNRSLPDYEGNSTSTLSRRHYAGTYSDDSLTIRFIQQDTSAQPSSQLRSQSSILDVMYGTNQVPSISSGSSTLATFVATELQEIFAEEQAVLADILTSAQASSNGIGQIHQASQNANSPSRDLRSRASHSLRPDLATRLANRRTRSLKYAPTYHITISLFSQGATPNSWEIEEAISEYLMPLLNAASKISTFSVDTQVQLHAALSPSVHSPEYNEEHRIWTLREEDLSAFINAAEWPLSPSIGAGPTLNFVLYVPDPANIPLVVKGSYAPSWLVPQWGGVFILNNQAFNSTEPSTTLTKAVIQPAILTFSHQLLSFLGAPETPPSLALQLQTLVRIQAASLLLSAASTMGSLARLTKALPTIAIPETVSAAVDMTLQQLQATCSSLKEGRFDDALDYARTAEAQAEKGFFEKSMVGQVYFPDEHKVAVYLPLLGPIGVPLAMSAIKEIKRQLAVWKQRRQV